MIPTALFILLSAAAEKRDLPPQPARAAEVQLVSFERTIGNVEYSAISLSRVRPPGVKKVPEVAGDVWFGSIMRRVPGDGLRDSSHYVPFMAEYVLGQASRAWCDTNFNGDITDDSPVRLHSYPAVRGARSFLVDLRWTARADSKEVPVDRKVRVVLGPAEEVDQAPTSRVHQVFAMVGTVKLEDRPHRAFLFDGNGDGLYTRNFFDGLFVDLDDNLHFDIDQMSEEFAPFGVPFHMGGGIYEVVSVDPEGHEISIREIGATKATEPPKVGALAPEFEFQDTTGRLQRLRDYRGRYVLLSFWASWCGNSVEEVETLRAIYDRFHPLGLDILGVSYDTDRAAMEAFRKEHRQTWPTSFSGRMFWEDSIGRMYQARWPGFLALINREGILEGIYDDPEVVVSPLAEVMPEAPSSAT